MAMVREFLRAKWRTWLGFLIVRNGEALRRLEVERRELLYSGVSDADIDHEIERRERRRDELLDKFKKEE